MVEITGELCEARLCMVNSSIANVEKRLTDLVQRNSAVDSMSKEELKTSIETLLLSTQKEMSRIYDEIGEIKKVIKECERDIDRYDILTSRETVRLDSIEKNVGTIKDDISKKLKAIELKSDDRAKVMTKILAAILGIMVLNLITGSWSESYKFIAQIFA
jgi:chromosome segregation ATPase